MAQPIDPQTGRPAEPGDPGYDWSQPHEDVGARLLGEARYTLGKGRRLLQDVTPEPEPVAPAHSGMRQFTDYLEEASVPFGLVGAVPSPASAPLLALSSLMAAPGGIRKLVSPEEDESRVGGAVQTGLSALPGVAAIRRGAGSLRGLLRGAGIGERATAAGPAGEVLTGSAMLDDVAARGLAQEGTQTLRSAVRGAIDEAPSNFPSSPTPEASIKQAIRRMNADAQSGARSTWSARDVSNPLFETLPEGGLNTIGTGLNRLGGAGARSVSNDIENLPELPSAWQQFVKPAGTLPPSSSRRSAPWTSLDALLAEITPNRQRLNIPARARAYRANTPFPE